MINQTKQLAKSKTVQWSMIGNAMLGTLATQIDALAVAVGMDSAKLIIALAAIINAGVTVWIRTITTKPIEEL